jgi:hypothetical protein
MIPHTELDSAASALRSAVERNDFAAVSASAVSYGEAARRVAGGLPFPEAERLIREVGREIEEGRRKLCTSRARMREQLHRLKQGDAYRALQQRHPHTWNLSG